MTLACPVDVVQAFAGVGNPHVIHPIAEGSRVVDIGSGAGTDLLLAGRQLVNAFIAAGFRDVHVTHRYDCFRGTSKEATARKFGVVGVNLSGVRNL